MIIVDHRRVSAISIHNLLFASHEFSEIDNLKLLEPTVQLLNFHQQKKPKLFQWLPQEGFWDCSRAKRREEPSPNGLAARRRLTEICAKR